MLRPALLALALTCSVLLAGCAQPVVPTNVIGAAEDVAQTAQVVISDAQAVWPVIYASIPAANQAAAQAAFNQAVFAANHADLALDDAISVAIAADSTNPDLTAVISSVSDAVAQIIAIVQTFQGATPTPAVQAGSSAIADMVGAAARLKALAAKR